MYGKGDVRQGGCTAGGYGRKAWRVAHMQQAPSLPVKGSLHTLSTCRLPAGCRTSPLPTASQHGTLYPPSKSACPSNCPALQLGLRGPYTTISFWPLSIWAFF